MIPSIDNLIQVRASTSVNMSGGSIMAHSTQNSILHLVHQFRIAGHISRGRKKRFASDMIPFMENLNQVRARTSPNMSGDSVMSHSTQNSILHLVHQFRIAGHISRGRKKRFASDMIPSIDNFNQVRARTSPNMSGGSVMSHSMQHSILHLVHHFRTVGHISRGRKKRFASDMIPSIDNFNQVRARTSPNMSGGSVMSHSMQHSILHLVHHFRTVGHISRGRKKRFASDMIPFMENHNQVSARTSPNMSGGSIMAHSMQKSILHLVHHFRTVGHISRGRKKRFASDMIPFMENHNQVSARTSPNMSGGSVMSHSTQHSMLHLVHHFRTVGHISRGRKKRFASDMIPFMENLNQVRARTSPNMSGDSVMSHSTQHSILHLAHHFRTVGHISRGRKKRFASDMIPFMENHNQVSARTSPNMSGGSVMSHSTQHSMLHLVHHFRTVGHISRGRKKRFASDMIPFMENHNQVSARTSPNMSGGSIMAHSMQKSILHLVHHFRTVGHISRGRKKRFASDMIPFMENHNQVSARTSPNMSGGSVMSHSTQHSMLHLVHHFRTVGHISRGRKKRFASDMIPFMENLNQVSARTSPNMSGDSVMSHSTQNSILHLVHQFRIAGHISRGRKKRFGSVVRQSIDNLIQVKASTCVNMSGGSIMAHSMQHSILHLVHHFRTVGHISRGRKKRFALDMIPFMENLNQVIARTSPNMSGDSVMSHSTQHSILHLAHQFRIAGHISRGRKKRFASDMIPFMENHNQVSARTSPNMSGGSVMSHSTQHSMLHLVHHFRTVGHISRGRKKRFASDMIPFMENHNQVSARTSPNMSGGSIMAHSMQKSILHLVHHFRTVGHISRGRKKRFASDMIPFMENHNQVSARTSPNMSGGSVMSHSTQHSMLHLVHHFRTVGHISRGRKKRFASDMIPFMENLNQVSARTSPNMSGDSVMSHSTQNSILHLVHQFRIAGHISRGRKKRFGSVVRQSIDNLIQVKASTCVNMSGGSIMAHSMQHSILHLVHHFRTVGHISRGRKKRFALDMIPFMENLNQVIARTSPNMSGDSVMSHSTQHSILHLAHQFRIAGHISRGRKKRFASDMIPFMENHNQVSARTSPNMSGGSVMSHSTQHSMLHLVHHFRTVGHISRGRKKRFASDMIPFMENLNQVRARTSPNMSGDSVMSHSTQHSILHLAHHFRTVGHISRGRKKRFASDMIPFMENLNQVSARTSPNMSGGSVMSHSTQHSILHLVHHFRIAGHISRGRKKRFASDMIPFMENHNQVSARTSPNMSGGSVMSHSTQHSMLHLVHQFRIAGHISRGRKKRFASDMIPFMENLNQVSARTSPNMSGDSVMSHSTQNSILHLVHQFRIAGHISRGRKKRFGPLCDNPLTISFR